MKTYELENLINAEHYGYDSQSNMLIEECAELIQAINKHKRAMGNGQPTTTGRTATFDNIIEEIADVELMIQQIKHLLNINNVELEVIKINKVARTKERMRKEDGKTNSR